MRVISLTIAIIAGFAALPSPAFAALRDPTGPWHVDYDTAQCVAMRDYGTAAKPLILALKPSPKGTVMRLVVMRKGSAEVEQIPATLRFGPNHKKTNMLSYSDEKHQFRLVSINVPMSEFKANMMISSITVDGGSLNETFAVSNLPAVAAELDKCVLDLQDYWNMGDRFAARFASSGKPEHPLKGLFSADDYPWMALVQNQQGSVKMTILVDEKGEVADCSVDDSSGVSALDTMSCYIVKKRAHFAPAVGRDGKPVRSAYTEKITWRIAG